MTIFDVKFGGIVGLQTDRHADRQTCRQTDIFPASFGSYTAPQSCFSISDGTFFQRFSGFQVVVDLGVDTCKRRERRTNERKGCVVPCPKRSVFDSTMASAGGRNYRYRRPVLEDSDDSSDDEWMKQYSSSAVGNGKTRGKAIRIDDSDDDDIDNDGDDVDSDGGWNVGGGFDDVNISDIKQMRERKPKQTTRRNFRSEQQRQPRHRQDVETFQIDHDDGSDEENIPYGRRNTEHDQTLARLSRLSIHNSNPDSPPSGESRPVQSNKAQPKPFEDNYEACAWDLDDKTNEVFLNGAKYQIPETEWPEISLPRSLYDRLFHHQKEGVQWMASMHENGVGGILGDDMGLGKTYQTLAFLGGLMRARTIRNAIIVAPMSVLRSWEKEIDVVIRKSSCVPDIVVSVILSSKSKAQRQRIVDSALLW